MLYYSYKNKLFSDYNVEVQNVRQIIEGSYPLHLWNIQPESIRSLNETLLSADKYLAINIYDKNLDDTYIINVSTYKINNGKQIVFEHATEPVTLQNRYTEVSTGFIEYQGSTIGKYEIYHTTEYLYDYLNRLIYSFLIIFISITLGVTLILLILLNKLVIRKMLALVDFAKNMASEKKYDNRISIKGHDEVSVLAESINEMLEEIELKDHQKDEARLKLSKSELYLKSIFDACPDAILILEMNQGVIIDVNNSAASIFLFDRTALIGKDLEVISSVEQGFDQKKAYAWLSKTRDKGPQRFEWLARRLNKEFFWAEIYARSARIGGKDCFIVLARDITERKQTEEIIRERETQLRALSDNLPGGFVYQIIMDGTRRRFVYLSAGAEVLGGIAVQEIIDDANLFYDMVHEEDRQTLAQKEASAQLNMSRFHAELRFQNVSGETLWLMLTAAPRPLSAGVVVWDGIAIDVTARKLAQAERKKLQQQLLQAQKMEAVGTLAGGVAHDFNNLLQAISGNIQMLEKGKARDHPDAKRLKTINNSIERAAQLVRQLLIFSRKAEVKRQFVDMNQLVEETANVLQRTIPRMIDIELRPAQEVWSVKASPVQVEQVLLNLGNNSAQAMPEGGRLIIETKNVILDKRYARAHMDAREGPHVLLSVTDTGCGMDKETQKHIFDPFFTTKEVGQGTGLGLSTVYGIITGHGGSVHCYSDPDQGTTFRLYWPAVVDPGESAEEDQACKARENFRGTETILVVDDEKDIRQVTAEALESCGYSVLEAASGEDALAVYAEKGNSVDLIIMDLGMPGMGGRQCLRELISLDPKVRVLVASGYVTGKLDQEVQKDGAAGFISKPFQFSELLARVHQVLVGAEK